jgi:DnaK suppressor protein
MAISKTQKKRKNIPAKKAAPKVQKKKEIIKPLKKKMPSMKIKTPKKSLGVGKQTPPKGEFEEMRKLFLEMRRKLISGITEGRTPETLIPSTDIGDIVDQAGDERDRELSLLLTTREKEKLLAIDEALEKIKEGTYGICEECGEKIGPGRLKVMPLAKSCVACQQNLEEEMTLQRRAEEDLTYRGLAYASNEDEEG